MAQSLSDSRGSTGSDPARFEWSSVFEGGLDPVKIAVDNMGNTVVLGSTRLNANYVVVKYSPSGDVVWSRTYRDSELGGIPRDMSLDQDGNVYVTGVSYVVSADLTLAPNHGDMVTIKYDADGEQLWLAQYNGIPHGEDESTALVVDKHGQVFVTGFSQGLDWDAEIITIAYDDAGRERWVSRYEWPGFGMGHVIALTDAGDVYVTGSGGQFQNTDGMGIVTIKYDSTGVQQWSTHYKDGGQAWLSRMVLDKEGQIYLAIVSNSNNSVVIKYDDDGSEVWRSDFKVDNSDDNRPSALVIDRTGHVYVGGQSRIAGRFASSVIRFDSTGARNWAVLLPYRPGSSSDDFVVDMELDIQGKLIVLSAQDYYYYAARYDELGHEEWALALSDHPFSTPRDMVLDTSGSIYATGNTDLSIANNNGFRFLTAKISLDVATSIEESEQKQGFFIEAVYPNPVFDRLSIGLNIDTADPVKLSVYDLIGRERAVILDGNQHSGLNVIEWDVPSLPAGVYFLIMESLGRREVKTVAINK